MTPRRLPSRTRVLPVRPGSARVAEVWRRGSVIASWLLDLTAEAMVQSPDLSDFSGTSRTRARVAGRPSPPSRKGVPSPVLSTALFSRFASRDLDHFGNQVLSAMRKAIRGSRREAGQVSPGTRSTPTRRRVDCRRRRAHALRRHRRPGQAQAPPRLFHLHEAGLMPNHYRIVGSAPAGTGADPATFGTYVHGVLEQFGRKDVTDKSWASSGPPSRSLPRRAMT